ncbi:MAG TPA: hypothetical protein VID27_06095 [Blastocatellia bacterium]
MPGETTQYKVRISEELVARFEELAEKYGRRSGNQVAAEILEIYTPLWEQAEAARMAVIDSQRAGVVDAGDVYMKGRGSKGEIERVVKDASARERAKKGRK